PSRTLYTPTRVSIALYTLSLHDALPISLGAARAHDPHARQRRRVAVDAAARDEEVVHQRRGHRAQRHVVDVVGAERLPHVPLGRSEEHTSELQSRENLVCRRLLEKKKQL